MATPKERFLSAYANIPLPLRKDIIVIIDKQPYTWETSYFEVKKDSPIAKKILNMLESMRII